MKKIAFLLYVILFTCFAAIAQEENNEKDNAPSPRPFSVEEIRVASQNTLKELVGVQEVIQDTLFVKELDSNFSVLKESNEFRVSADSLFVDYSQASLWVIKDQGKIWRDYLAAVNEFETQIDARIDNLTNELKAVSLLNGNWVLTGKMIDTISVSQGFEETVAENISLTQETVDEINEAVDELIVLSRVVKKEIGQVNGIISEVERLQLEKAGDALSRDSKPLITALRQDGVGFKVAFKRAVKNAYQDIMPFAKENGLNFLSHFILLLVLFLLFLNMGKRFRKSTYVDDPKYATAAIVFGYPFLSSIALSLLLSRFFYTDFPVVFIQTLFVIGLLPTIFLLPGILGLRLKYFKYLLALVVLLDILAEMMVEDQADQRLLLIFTSGLTLSAIIYGMWPTGKVYASLKKRGSFLVRFLLVAFAVSLVASIFLNVRGNYQLTLLLTMGIIDSLFVGILAFVAVRVIQSVLQLLIRTGFYGKVSFLFKYAKSAEFWATGLVALYGLFVWGRSFLRSFSLMDGFTSLKTDFLEHSWQFGEVTLSVRNLTDFVLILAIFWAISNVLNIILKELVATRLDMRKGLPMAIAILSKYIVLFLGFVLAMAAAGISLSKLNLIIGALGVGVGFGLQSIVSNLVSGLVILFERPIHIGDTVTAGLIEGEVTSIGLRSSTIRTWDGAEVIVPNNNLVANEVTNWTYSDTKRRVERIVYVDSGPNPRKVKMIIDNVLKDHEGLISNPQAQAYFLGNENNGLKYRVLMWMNSGILNNPSEVLLNIHDALTANGYKPFMPVQRIIMDDDSKKVADMPIIGMQTKEGDEENN